MADVTIDAAAGVTNPRGVKGTVFVTPLKGYHFYVDGDNDLKYVTTTNGGSSWSGLTTITTGTVDSYDIWFDKWTAGNTDSIIHIWSLEAGADDVLYYQLNTINNVLSSAVIVLNATSNFGSRGVFVSGAKMRGGNLLCCFNIDGGTETGTYRSIDNGATWTSRTNIIEADIDLALVFPANETDPNDAWILYQDASTDEVTLKVHDDSANTNSESSLIMSMVEETTDGRGQYGISGSIRHSDGHLIFAAWNAFDSATGDFRVFDVASSSSWTELTALATDKDDSYYPSVFIDQATNALYVAYTGKLDGTETLLTSASVYYAKSTDGGINWTTNIAYSATGSDWGQTWAPLMGPRFLVVWRDISAQGLLTNFDNSLQLGKNNTFNNYAFASARGVGNTGIISVTEKIR